ncbi:MAG: hypothetical protein QM346_03835 [Chloroflexota bacterium]|nr:hypothetical protein [Chloroflexota bacterium]
MRRFAWLRCLLALALIAGMAAPTAALATGFDASPVLQAGPAGPGAAAATAGLAEVARIVRPTKSAGAASPVAPAQEPALAIEEMTPTPTPESLVEELMPTPEPESMVEEVTPTPDAAAVILVPTPSAPTPEPDAVEESRTAEEQVVPPPAMETVQYSNAGVSLLAPSGWLVEPGEFGTLFNIEDPERDFIGLVQPLGADEFPGMLAVILFKTQPEAFVTAIDPGASLVGVDFFMTGQQLPVTKIVFSNEGNVEAGEIGAGAIYLVSPGAETYALFAFAAPDVWPDVEAGADLTAESLFFDPSLITVVTAEGGPMDYVDAESGLRLVLPEGWQIAPTDDADLPAIVADPDFELAGMLGIAPGTPQEEGLDVAGLLQSLESGEDSADAAELVQTIVDMIGFSSEEFVQDESLTDLLLIDDVAVLRVGGQANIDEMLGIPLMFYVAMDEERLSVLILFGAEDQVLLVEPEIFEIITSADRIE